MPVVYARPGYEITMQPAFSLVLNADRRRTPNDLTSRAHIQMSNNHVTNHLEGRLTVENLVGQFNRGKWNRYISSSCPAVTGRSSFLDASGGIADTGCGIDPEYKIDPDEWIKLFKNSQNFQWIGEGVLASLSVGYSDDIRGIAYTLEITFEDYATVLAINSENEARRRKEGDAKGWNTTSKAQKNLKIQEQTIKTLEENAAKRGDTIMNRSI